jgi:tetratricopeptide (TPR) repeat protein
MRTCRLKETKTGVQILLLLLCCNITQWVLAQSKTIIIPRDTAFINAANDRLAARRGDSTNTMDSLLQCIATSRDMKYRDGEGYGYTIIASKLALRGMVQQSVPYFEKSAAAYHAGGNMKDEAAAYADLAYAMRLMDRHIESLKTAQKSIELASRADDKVTQVRMHLMVANVYSSQSKYDSTAIAAAHQSFDKAQQVLEVAEKDKKILPHTVAVMYISLNVERSNVFFEQKNHVMSSQHLHRALFYAQKTKRPDYFSLFALANLGNLHVEQRQPDSAFYFLNKALAIGRGQGFENTTMAAIHRDLGRSFKMRGNTVEARKQYDTAMRYAQLSNSATLLRDAEKGFYELDSESGRFADALKHHEAFKKLEDSIYSTEKTKTVNDIKIRYDTEKKELENTRLKTQSVFRRNIIILLAALATALLAGLVFFYRSRRLQRNLFQERETQLVKEKELQATIAAQQQQTLEKENENLLLNKMMDEEENRRLKELTDLQERQLTSANLSLEQQNKQLLEVYERLYHIGQKLNDEDKTLVKALRQQVKGNLYLGGNWEKVTLHFEKVHPRFFEKLKAVNANLTPNELKLCAYTRLNLSTKDISLLMNIDTQSVRMNRYRLKKKLQLPEELDVQQYINDI